MVTVFDLVKQEKIDKIFLMHLSYGTGDSSRRNLWNYATANNLIGLDYIGVVDDRFDRLSTKKRERLSKVWIHQFQLFEEMQIGDVVAIMAGEDRLLGICRVNGDYKFISRHRDNFFGHVRPVLWLVKKEFDQAIRFHLPKGRRFTRTLRIIKHEDPRTRDIWESLMRIKIKRIRLNSFVKKKKPEISKSSKKKYGPAGEGPQHREFKKWISRNPQRLGLPEPKETLVEYQLKSGECPDVLFLFEEGSYAVVEVETEHEVYRGAYQALKYKVLICAENGYPINSDKVKAFLVAYERDKNASSICSRYGIEYKVFPKF